MTMRRSVSFFRFFALVGLLALLSACASERAPTSSKGATGAGSYKVGKPYQIKGIWYYPKEDYSYDETGIASWYGDDFHMKRTANGEIFNKDELTAAHATLPMPSLARVTNLENGRSLVVRINDRGPFSGARIIDTTQRVAQLLGFEKQGTCKMRVQVLADESKAIADAMRRYGSPAPESGGASSIESVAYTAASPAQTQPSQRIYQEPGPSQDSVQTFDEPSGQTASAAMSGRSGVGTSMSGASVQRQPLTVANVQPVPEVRQLVVTGQQQIYIQAGAFTNRNNAERMERKLRAVGQVRVADADVRGVRYYRVRVGPLPDVTSADRTLKQVNRSGAADARIVVD